MRGYIETSAEVGPAHWASYIISGDDSGLLHSDTPSSNAGTEDKALCDEWLAELAADGWSIVSTKEDEEPWFTCAGFYTHGCLACDVLTYTLIRQVQS